MLVTIQFVKNKRWYFKWKSLIILKLPFFGTFVEKIKIARFTQALALLTGAKVLLLNGLHFIHQKKLYKKLKNDVLLGKSLYKAIKGHSFLIKKGFLN